MDELVKLVSEKAGIQEKQAEKAIDAVMGFLKEKLPEPIAGQIESAISSDAAVKQASKLLDQGVGALGGLLGKKK